MKEIRTTGNRIIIEREKEKSRGLIEVPNPRDSLIGKVLAVGPKVEILIPGDRVLVRHTVGHELTLDTDSGRKTYLIVEENNVEGLVSE